MKWPNFIGVQSPFDEREFMCNQYVYNVLVFGNKHQDKFKKNSDLQRCNTWNQNKFITPEFRLAKTCNSVNCITSKFYNVLPTKVMLPNLKNWFKII